MSETTRVCVCVCVLLFFCLIRGFNLLIEGRVDTPGLRKSRLCSPVCSGISFISNWCYLAPRHANPLASRGHVSFLRACSCFRQSRIGGPPPPPYAAPSAQSSERFRHRSSQVSLYFLKNAFSSAASPECSRALYSSLLKRFIVEHLLLWV